MPSLTEADTCRKYVLPKLYASGWSDGVNSLLRFHSLRPSPKPGRVGSCVSLFEACSAFTHVTACMLAESPMRPSTPKASAASLPPLLLRLLPGGTNQFPGGISLPLRTSAFSRRTPSTRLGLITQSR